MFGGDDSKLKLGIHMYYEGPIYRPPSEADSLLIQATIGCPYNKCSFCMIYKKGPPFRIRPVKDICEDLIEARAVYGSSVKTLFFPAGNTIAMPTKDLVAICRFAKKQFVSIGRITVYGSSRYIVQKDLKELHQIAEAGLSRIHVGLESGSDEVLNLVKKGASAREQILAGKMVRNAGMQLSEYVVLGLGGTKFTEIHARETAKAINAIVPDFVRLRTLVPKVNTLLLHQIQKGRFQILTPHQVLQETRSLIERIKCHTYLKSDHYTNYINLEGELPNAKERLLEKVDEALKWDESKFRPFFIGSQ